MMEIRRRTKNVSDENSEEIAQPMNVNINIACSVDPKTGVSRCRILYPNPVPEVGDDHFEEFVEGERKRDQEFEEHLKVEAEEEAKERYHRRALKKHDVEEEEEEADPDDDEDTEDSEVDDGEVDPVDDPENSKDDVVPERVTRSTMKKAIRRRTA